MLHSSSYISGRDSVVEAMLNVLKQFESHFPADVRLRMVSTASHSLHPAIAHSITSCTIQPHQCPFHPISILLVSVSCPLPSYFVSFSRCTVPQCRVILNDYIMSSMRIKIGRQIATITQLENALKSIGVFARRVHDILIMNAESFMCTVFLINCL